VSLDLLARILNQPDPEPWARNLELAQLARFVPGTPDAVTAFHDRIRDVVVSGTDTAHRRRLHARSVEALERTADPDLVALTLHYLGCDRGRDAAGCAVRAARRAASVLAFEQAAAMYRLALELGRWSEPERVDLRVRLAEALVFDHRSGEAGTQFVEAASRSLERLRDGSTARRSAMSPSSSATATGCGPGRLSPVPKRCAPDSVGAKSCFSRPRPASLW
jgi:hypothetical protein